MIKTTDIATHLPHGAAAAEARTTAVAPSLAKTGRMFLRLLRAAQPISRIEIATRLGVNRSTVTDIAKPLIAANVVRETAVPMSAQTNRLQGRPRIGLTFESGQEIFAGVHIGVRGSQLGLTDLSGTILAEENCETLENPSAAVELLRTRLDTMRRRFPDRTLKIIGISVPGVTDTARRNLVYAPHLDWRDVPVADAFAQKINGDPSDPVTIIVENDATAAVRYEARLRLGKTAAGLLKDFILVRSGTGIGVGLLLDGEVYRGTGRNEGTAGEFGHMTIVAGGKPCVCGNRGCWERYAAAAAASALYTGDRMQLGATKPPRYVEIVERAEAGEIRAQRTLEKIGEYLGIGIGNVITGVGVPQVILSGRIVDGWKFLKKPLREAVGKSLAGQLSGWSVEAGEARGAGLGGALEVAVEEYLAFGFRHLI